ncbi:MAG: hypothetical protein PVG41_14515, partial [Desulfobacteraceae bacterium]
MTIIAVLNKADLANLLFRWLHIALPFRLRLGQSKAYIMRRIWIRCQGASKGANALSVPVDA